MPINPPRELWGLRRPDGRWYRSTGILVVYEGREEAARVTHYWHTDYRTNRTHRVDLTPELIGVAPVALANKP